VGSGAVKTTCRSCSRTGRPFHIAAFSTNLQATSQYNTCHGCFIIMSNREDIRTARDHEDWYAPLQAQRTAVPVGGQEASDDARAARVVVADVQPQLTQAPLLPRAAAALQSEEPHAQLQQLLLFLLSAALHHSVYHGRRLGSRGRFASFLFYEALLRSLQRWIRSSSSSSSSTAQLCMCLYICTHRLHAR
jgi:hypothetical protein